MIKSLTLINFQSHRLSKFLLDKGVNVFHGLSQAGKSSVLRGVDLVTRNRPSGARYYSHFAPAQGQAEIHLSLQEGVDISIIKTVSRGKDGAKTLKETEYLIHVKGNRSGAGYDLAFSPGAEVPSEVRQFLNLGEVNVQKQLEGPFLITSSPGVIARTINRITKLEDVDAWKSELTKRINRGNQEVALLNDQARQIETELARYKGFEDLEEVMAKLKEVDSAYGSSLNRRNRLDASLIKIEKAAEAKRRLSPALKVEEDLDQIDILTREIEVVAEEKYHLNRVIVLTETMGRLRKLEMDLEKVKVMEEVFERRNAIKEAIGRMTDIDIAITGLRQLYKTNKETYLGLLEESRRCPTCFAPIDREALKRIREEL